MAATSSTGTRGTDLPAGGTGPDGDRPSGAAPDSIFDDVLRANEAYAASYHLAGLEGRAAKRLAVLTCMDSRIDPLGMLGLSPGDAKILRNAGARVTDDVLRTLVLAAWLLDVERVMVVAHTRCAMARGDEATVHTAIADAGGPDSRSISFLTTGDQEASLRADLQRIRSWPYLYEVAASGFLLDLDSGRLRRVC